LPKIFFKSQTFTLKITIFESSFNAKRLSYKFNTMTTNNSIIQKVVFTLVAVSISTLTFGQLPTTVLGQTNAGRVPTPTMLFLNVSPDARSAGMGDAGVATSNDANAIYWNPAKLATLSNNTGGSISYTPWLRNLVDDMALYNISAYFKPSNDQAFGFSINYFDQGLFQATSANGTSAGNFNSKEYALTGSWSKRLGSKLYFGGNLKYINSNLTGGYQAPGSQMKPAQTVAADASLYWNSVTEKDWNLTYGLVISNISGKVSYGGQDKNFIPTNLRFGIAAEKNIDEKNKVTFTTDFNKLMVPTPQSVDVNGHVTGTDPNNTTAIGGIFGSLFDAPDGFGEEIKEVTTSLGAEYLYNNTIAVRGGYFNESEMKGNRKYFTMGVGFKVDKKYGFDFAYLIPTGSSSPLANTLRVSLVIATNQPLKK
jgi:hypothetical protein